MAFLFFVQTGHAQKPDTTATADTAKTLFESDHRFSLVTIVLPHNSLRNSKSLHNWPFFAFVMPAVEFKYKAKKEVNNLLTLKGEGSLAPGVTGIALRTDFSLELIHLLEVGIELRSATALNLGDYATFLGVYNPEKRDYDTDIIFTEYAYGIRYHSTLTIPLLAFLPKSNWTKIILKASGDLEYSGYTGADNGEVWKAGAENLVNGYRYRCGGTLIYMLPFQRFPMFMVSANTSGFKHESDFDKVYSDYNPDFRTFSIIPMLSVKISDKWNGMLMTSFSRNRVFENESYDPAEEMLQKQIGAEWNLRTIMFIASRKF